MTDVNPLILNLLLKDPYWAPSDFLEEKSSTAHAVRCDAVRNGYIMPLIGYEDNFLYWNYTEKSIDVINNHFKPIREKINEFYSMDVIDEPFDFIQCVRFLLKLGRSNYFTASQSAPYLRLRYDSTSEVTFLESDGSPSYIIDPVLAWCLINLNATTPFIVEPKSESDFNGFPRGILQPRVAQWPNREYAIDAFTISDIHRGISVIKRNTAIGR